jgi:protein involved in polysaccharide export with SLBB domain
MKQFALTATAVTMTMLAFTAASPVSAQDTAPSGGQIPAPAAPATPAPAPASTPATDTTPVVSAPVDYRLDTDDTINIEVARANGSRFPDVTRSVRIPVDGTFRLGRGTSPIQARGKTCNELETEIREKLTTEGGLRLKPSQVTVSVVGMRQRRVYVSGTAVRNGEYDLKNGWRVSELVAVIGGVQEPQRVTARLVNPQRPAPVPVDLDAALNNPDAAANIALVEGDTLMLDVPKSNILYVKGEGPRGEYRVDTRMGLRQAMIKIGFNTANQSGSLREAILIRHDVPGDPTSPQTRTKIDLYNLMSNPEAPEVSLQDMDTLEIPISKRYVYIYGEIGGPPRKWFLPEDRKAYLVDILADVGGTNRDAKIGEIRIWRQSASAVTSPAFSASPANDTQAKPSLLKYDFGKFLSNGDPKQNPELQPQDVVMVPNRKATNVVNTIWTGWGLFGIVQSLVPGARLR